MSSSDWNGNATSIPILLGKALISNTRTSNLEKSNLELISNLIGVNVGVCEVLRFGGMFGVCVGGGGHDYR